MSKNRAWQQENHDHRWRALKTADHKPADELIYIHDTWFVYMHLRDCRIFFSRFDSLSPSNKFSLYYEGNDIRPLLEVLVTGGFLNWLRHCA
jgi:hypothetical protein